LDDQVHTPYRQESRWLRVLSTLNEYQSRLFVADKARDQGRGGISRLSELTGMSRTTITKALHARQYIRLQFAVQTEGVGRIGSGNDFASGLHYVHHHFVAAGGVSRQGRRPLPICLRSQAGYKLNRGSVRRSGSSANSFCTPPPANSVGVR